MKTKYALLLALTMCTMACTPKTEIKSSGTVVSMLPRASKETEAILEKEFPGILPGPVFGDSILNYIERKYGIAPDQILLGASTCVDDIIYTKNFHLHPELKGPFHLGGLAGLPFTGISGLDALAHHIPDGGAMLLLITPHIGYSQTKGWGYVLRHEQHEPSTCCGALMGTLGKLEKGTIATGITEDDYQGGKIGELALAKKTEILQSESPIIALTKLTSIEAERQIREHVLAVDMEHMTYIIIATGVMINTDYAFTDYFSMDHFMVYGVREKKFVEDLRKPAAPAP